MPFDIYLQTIDEVKNAFDGLHAPIYYVPGNHDCDAQEGSFEAFARQFPIPETLDIVNALAAPAPGARQRVSRQPT